MRPLGKQQLLVFDTLDKKLDGEASVYELASLLGATVASIRKSAGGLADRRILRKVNNNRYRISPRGRLRVAVYRVAMTDIEQREG